MKYIWILFLFSLSLASGQSKIDIDMTAQMSGSIQLADGSTTKIWVFRVNGSSATLPNTTIEVHVDDTVNLNVFNASQMKHTIHLHGLDVDQANDGVESTSQAINSFNSFTYTFIPKHAGMFFYHCHIESTIHVQLGMYGALIVKPIAEQTAWTDGPVFDKEYNWLLSDLDKSWHDSPPLNGNIPLFEPDHFLINGKSTLNLNNDTTTVIQGTTNQDIYLRIGNMGYGVNKITFPTDLFCEVVQSDGRPLPSPFHTNEINLYPGERYEIMISANTPVNDSITIAYEDMQGNVQGENRVPVVIDLPVANKINHPLENSVYPNPAKDKLYLPELTNQRIEVFDILGNVFDLTLKDNQLDISPLVPGIYFIHANNKTWRILKN